MAAAQLSHGYSSLPSVSSSSRQESPAARMYDLPRELSSSQLEAKQTLARLLDGIKERDSKYYDHYGKWVERHPRLEDFCFQCVRPQVWTFLSGRWSLDALKMIGGDLKFEGRSVYLDGVLGLDRRVRIYVGQTTSLRQRVAQHLNFRYRRDNPSLHYHAMQYSIYNTIGCLATLPPSSMGKHALPGMDCPDLLLNVMEMWMCLVFRTLPSPISNVWLHEVEEASKGRKKGKEGEFGGLNIASPLDHGRKQRECVDLSDSDDPLLVEYMNITQRPFMHQKKEEELNIKEEQDTPAERKKKYAEAARRQRNKDQDSIHAPQWVVLGGLAVAFGFIILKSRGGPQPQSRVHFRC